MKKHLSKFIIGIPFLLLIVALVLSIQDSKTHDLNEDFNKYLNPLPLDYGRALGTAKTNDSTFFTATVNDYAIRKLLIFKTFPDDNHINTDFIVNIYPSNKTLLEANKEFLTFNITNDAVLFNNNDKTYGVFKLPLPLIDIEKMIVKNKIQKKIDQPWQSTLDAPFKKLEKVEVSNSLKSNEIEKEPFLFTSLFTKQLDAYDIKYLPSSLQEKNKKVNRYYQPIDDFIASENLTLITIVKPKIFWKKINTRDNTALELLEFNGEKSNMVKELLGSYLNNEKRFGAIINQEKLAYYNALKPLFVEDCQDIEYFVFNDDSNLLEPLHAMSNCPREKALSYLKASEIENQDYLKSYRLALQEVSKINLYETLINNNAQFKNEVAFINKSNPNHIFDFDVLKVNQRVINKSLNPSSALKSELISINSEEMVLSVFNTSNYAIDIIELSHFGNKTITSLNPVVNIKSQQKDTITIALPRSFENLFVSKKKKIIGFVLPKHINELKIKYRLTSLNKTHISSIIPYQKNNDIEDDIFRNKTYINNHRDIIVNESTKEISFSKDSIVIDSPLVINKNYTFTLKPGTIINIIKGGKIISHSPLRFIGTKENPIKVYSSDRKGQGLLVLSEQKKSKLKHVIFDHLRNPTHANWGVTGAVTFYESPVDLQNVSIKNNACEDALNIVRAKFTMDQVTLYNTQSDAFDGDYVQGTISNCNFDELGNDAIDVSGSSLIIRNVTISNAGDKGLSAGENSKMDVDNVDISNSEIAVAGKDLSIVIAKNLKISNTKLGFTAFQKKPEFGPSNITVNNVSMLGIETKYLIESSSSMIVDSKKIETTQNVKDRMYGVEFGVSSDETRNTPKQ
nr:right-handed parallel beta-helix repeat-containing protein [uncultured Psychroserpens sp.]